MIGEPRKSGVPINQEDQIFRGKVAWRDGMIGAGKEEDV